MKLTTAAANACHAITAFLAKITHGEEKIDQYKRAIGQHIVALRKERPKDWEHIVQAECGLKRRQAYKYLAIVNGAGTVEAQRAANVAANKRLRDRQRASRDAQNPPRPEAARERDQDLAGQLQAARIKIAELESEIDELKAENSKLRTKLKKFEHEPVLIDGAALPARYADSVEAH
jgi:hypothetical protein